MEEQLKEIRRYFLDKILKGDYEMKMIDAHYLNVKVDKKYDFCFWVSNQDYGLKQDSSWGNVNTVYLGKLTIKQQKSLWSKFRIPYNNYKTDVTLKAKKAEFEKLRKELNIE